MITKENIKEKDIVYFSRIIPSTEIYEICELIIRTVEIPIL